ncbi:AAA family ATPase [bacterium]|jgi:SpoVK/Ycf46/Vps4 family AAA+-type ATPase|nr:AAA family ATPase [bacterium]
MSKKSFLVLFLFMFSTKTEDRFRFDVKADCSRKSLDVPLENRSGTARFEGLSGKFHPYLFYVRDKLQREPQERKYEYQKKETEESTQSKRERIKKIRKLIEERRPKDGRRESGIDITLPEAFEDDSLPFNRILLMGKSGTGKTSSIRALAKESGCICIDVTPRGSYQSEGQEIIVNRLLEALLKASETGRRVLLYFDECHEFAEEKTQDSSAKTLLWQILDKYGKDPRLLLVASTHKKKNIDHAYKRRWKVIEYDLPTQEELRDIIRQKAKEKGCNGLPDQLIESMVRVPNITGAHIDVLFSEVAAELQSRSLTIIDSGYILCTLKKLENDTRDIESIEKSGIPDSLEKYFWEIAGTVTAGLIGKAIGGGKLGDEKAKITETTTTTSDSSASPAATASPVEQQPPLTFLSTSPNFQSGPGFTF